MCLTLHHEQTGLDRVFWYTFDPATGALTNGTGGGSEQLDNYVYTTNLGSGPRHMTLTTTSGGVNVAHVINELSNTIESFEINPQNGALTNSLGVIDTLPSKPLNTDDQMSTSMNQHDPRGAVASRIASHRVSGEGDSDGDSKAAEILSSKDGKWIYASNRGDAYGSDSVVVFEVNSDSGALSTEPRQAFYSGGSFPRGMEMFQVGDEDDGALKLVVGGQDSDSICVFDVDNVTGLINELPQFTLNSVVTPVTFA
jgi:6-phosphogluconolactonase (cycloisomerase 2 family)